MAPKSKSGKVAVLYNDVLGTLLVGDASTALPANTWYKIAAVAASGSVLPFSGIDGISAVGRVFQTGTVASAITPIVGDDVYPITRTKICKVDASVSTEKGTINVTDDCEDGYNAYLTDGYSDISGSISAFMKFDDIAGGLATSSKVFLGQFFDIATDDGAGVYTLTPKSDADLYLDILMNSDQSATGQIQVWMSIPVILTGVTTDKPLKGVQNLDSNYQKGQGPASIYERTLNSEETA